MHLGVVTDTDGVIGDGLLEVFALNGLIALDSFRLGHFMSSLVIIELLVISKIRLVVLQLLLCGLTLLLSILLRLESHFPIQKLILDLLSELL